MSCFGVNELARIIIWTRIALIFTNYLCQRITRILRMPWINELHKFSRIIFINELHELNELLILVTIQVILFYNQKFIYALWYVLILKLQN